MLLLAADAFGKQQDTQSARPLQHVMVLDAAATLLWLAQTPVGRAKILHLPSSALQPNTSSDAEL
jgi:hypothetical protein